jgi:ribosomal protein S18 acetylase RimI-like enzyme
VPELSFESIRDADSAAQCAPLFREYAEWSSGRLATEYGIELSRVDLELPHAWFEEEWPKLFGPRGRFYLANVDGVAAGVGALMPVSEDLGEVKRMYVRPAYRGAGIGRRILEQLLDDAREMQYRAVRLETMSYMTEAQRLYRSLGFVSIEPFAAEGAVMGLDKCELFMLLEL